MTALPKHWPSSRRQGRRRAGQKKSVLPGITTCKNCGQPKKGGFQCPNCRQ